MELIYEHAPGFQPGSHIVPHHADERECCVARDGRNGDAVDDIGQHAGLVALEGEDLRAARSTICTTSFHLQPIIAR
jgi:hypothetical protein